MLLPIYIFLASLCSVLINQRLRFDPFILLLPCGLLAVDGQDSLHIMFVSLLPVMLCYALFRVLQHRNEIEIERFTRLGAGLSLGGFVGVQLVFLLPISFLFALIGLLGLSLLSILLWKAMSKSVLNAPPQISLVLGLVLGAVQFFGLGSGLALLADHSQRENVANRAALWALALVGAIIGVFALPTTAVTSYFSIPILMASFLGGMTGLLILKRINVSQFESKVLDWIVLAMCISVWGHLLFKHIIFAI